MGSHDRLAHSGNDRARWPTRLSFTGPEALRDRIDTEAAPVSRSGWICARILAALARDEAMTPAARERRWSAAPLHHERGRRGSGSMYPIRFAFTGPADLLDRLRAAAKRENRTRAA